MEKVKKYDWAEFYMEFSNKLLEYKENRTKLVEKLVKIYKELGFNYPLKDGEEIAKDVGPFSVIGIFNRNISKEHRTEVLKKIKKEFGISAKIPTDFSGIPIVSNFKVMFYHFSPDRKETDIPNLWNLFETSIKYADNPNDNTYTEFCKNYNKVIKQELIEWKITIGLFWIRPYQYLSLDANSRSFFETDSGEYRKIMDISNLKEVPEAEEYIKIVDECKRIFKSKKSKYKNFIELSEAAFISKPKVLLKRPKGLKEDDVLEQTNKNKENQLENKQYFWLNAKPKTWSYSELEVGETVEYTSKSENGNKRKVYQNFINARKGDIVIGYETTPNKQIVAICEIEEELKNGIIKIRKTKNLVSTIPYKEIEKLEPMQESEFMKNPNGSLFKLKQAEYDSVMELIKKYNPDLYSKPKKYLEEDFLKEVYISKEEYKKLVGLLERKQNIILRGAPGVGKTFMARRLAYSIMEKEDNSRVQGIQFHQSYSYEDFIQGYRPTANSFELQDGVFYEFCKKAKADGNRPYFFIIDEINRGNLSKIFGELFALLDHDKRGEELKLVYSLEHFSVPSNLYIIGMMNTADKSLAKVEYALRRRFGFYTVNPAFESEGFKKYQEKLNNKKFNEIIKAVQELNKEIAEDSTLGKGFKIGHSYFCNIETVKDEELESIIDYEILPLLEEYWDEFDDTDQKYKKWKKRLKGILNG